MEIEEDQISTDWELYDAEKSRSASTLSGSPRSHSIPSCWIPMLRVLRF